MIRRLRLLLPAVLGLTLAACSEAPAPTPATGTASPTSTASASATSSRPAKTVVTGAPAELADLVAQRYGAKVVRGTASLGTWNGEKVAVVTVGVDVTLAVTSPRWKVVGGWWPSLGRSTPDVGGRAFVLALGSDARVKEGQRVDRSRADAIQLIGRDGSGGGGVLGIPRDSWVPLASGGSNKINAAMVFGGPRGMTETVALATGLPVKRYLLMSFGDVRETIDGLGGLPIVSDLSLPAEKIHKGPMTLSGDQALWYARERKSLPDGDFGRSRHQGQLLLAAAIKGRLKGIAWTPTVITTLDAHSQSNLTATEVLQWFATFHTLSPAKTGHGVATGTPAMISGQSAVRLGRTATERFRQFRDGRL